MGSIKRSEVEGLTAKVRRGLCGYTNETTRNVDYVERVIRGGQF